VALSPMAGTATPKEPWPSARTPVAAAIAPRSGATPGTMAAKQPRVASAAMASASVSGGTQSTARSAATGSAAMEATGSKPSGAMPTAKSRPWNLPAALLRASKPA